MKCAVAQCIGKKCQTSQNVWTADELPIIPVFTDSLDITDVRWGNANTYAGMLLADKFAIGHVRYFHLQRHFRLKYSQVLVA